ncbi:MAG: single-stranded DNA-binding protein [Beduini sp.]|uniref:single-stranded DNA-binding protein n=1 Tax=Beduini sp. TaxID=1922300 RepID=UPI0039A24A4E
MINRVVLVGRMTRDPELRRTSSGAAVTSFSLAINRNYQSASGEQQTDFINCVVWNKVAENVERYCSKGSLVGIEGRIQSRQYDAQDGTKRTVVEVVCDSVQFLETKNNNTQPVANGPIKRSDLDVNNSFDLLDDDIQF